MSIESRESFLARIATEPVYLKYDFEDCVLRSEPGVGWFVKFNGKDEFKAEIGSGVVTEAKLNPVEITKEEYEKF